MRQWEDIADRPFSIADPRTTYAHLGGEVNGETPGIYWVVKLLKKRHTEKF